MQGFVLVFCLFLSFFSSSFHSFSFPFPPSAPYPKIPSTHQSCLEVFIQQSVQFHSLPYFPKRPGPWPSTTLIFWDSWYQLIFRNKHRAKPIRRWPQWVASFFTLLLFSLGFKRHISNSEVGNISKAIANFPHTLNGTCHIGSSLLFLSVMWAPAMTEVMTPKRLTIGSGNRLQGWKPGRSQSRGGGVGRPSLQAAMWLSELFY